jgi:hypothetical protein
MKNQVEIKNFQFKTGHKVYIKMPTLFVQISHPLKICKIIIGLFGGSWMEWKHFG